MILVRYTRILRSIFDNMRQVEVDALDRRVLGNDHVHDSSGAATDINDGFEALEAFVSLKDFLHGNGGVVSHSLVEDLVESRVSSMVIKRSHAIGLVKWNPTIKNCILQMIPSQTQKNLN